MRIPSKAAFFELWEAGVLGNRTRLWRNPMDAYKWGLAQAAARQSGRSLPEIGFRQIGSSGGGAWEKVPWSKVLDTASRWENAGRTFIMDDGAPDDCRTIQGEICRTYRGLEGFIDTVGKLPMRPAAAAGHMRPTSPMETLALLRTYMDPSSQEDLWALLELYPDAAVEFSCFRRNVGIFPNRNTLFWETRDY